MAENVNVFTPQQQIEIMTRYQAKFGEAGEFDTWLVPGDPIVQLMAEALVRGTPVTESILHAKYREIEGEDPPEYDDDSIR